MILSRSNNSYTSIKTYASQQSGVFIIKCYFGISNIATYRQKMSSVGSFINNRCPIIFHCAKNLGRETGNDKQTTYFTPVIKTRHMTVSRDNGKITRKEMSKLFSCDYNH